MKYNGAKKNWITAALLLAGVALICIGIAVGEAETVLAKATRVCMQCIGID